MESHVLDLELIYSFEKDFEGVKISRRIHEFHKVLAMSLRLCSIGKQQA